MFKHVIDKDIELKLIDHSQAHDLFALIDKNRMHLRKWLPFLDITKTVEDTLGFINGAKQQYASNNGFQATIWYKGQLAGIIGLHNINWRNKSTSIGYWLGEEFQGHGIMTKACKAVINYVFTELALERVEIRCAEENSSSRAIPERLGFTNEGTLRNTEWLYDHFVSHVVYGVLKNEWKAI